MDKALVSVNALKEIPIFVVIDITNVINIDYTDSDIETGGRQEYMQWRSRCGLGLHSFFYKNT